MKLLQNKSTGEIGCLVCSFEKTPERITVVEYIDGKRGSRVWYYDTLDQLNEEWEDYEEQKEEDWYINEDNEPQRVCFGFPIENMEKLKEIGLLFKTKEETEKAVEKLKAFTRLKDKGFKFAGCGRYHWTGEEWPHIAFSYPNFNDLFDDRQTVKDLDLLFGGEE